MAAHVKCPNFSKDICFQHAASGKKGWFIQHTHTCLSIPISTHIYVHIEKENIHMYFVVVGIVVVVVVVVVLVCVCVCYSEPHEQHHQELQPCRSSWLFTFTCVEVQTWCPLWGPKPFSGHPDSMGLRHGFTFQSSTAHSSLQQPWPLSGHSH